MSLLLSEGVERGRVKSTLMKRKSKRTTVDGFVGDIADGNFVFPGVIDDISSSGIKISNLPLDFSSTKPSYSTVISGNGKNYRIIVRPCWTKKNMVTKTMEAGFQIIDTPWEWDEFVHGLKNGKDVLEGEFFHA